MKKLMLLGGSRYALPVIEAAHDLGIYVITCDYLPNNIAHKYSDQYVNVSIIDKEAVLQKAIELKIDGIMSFACDPGVVTAAYVAEQMGLPTTGPYKSICILQNKGMFRQFLTENGFNVPKARSYKDVDSALKEANEFHWPIIVKPTDSAGSKGVSKVERIEDLKEAIEKALAYSHCDEFIIEDFLKQVGYSSDCDSFSINGKMVFYSFNSQRFDDKAENPYTPAAYSWPSSISKQHREELQNEIQRLIKLLGLKTSVYNIETRECVDGKAYIMELSPRGGGNRLSEMIRLIYGVDMIKEAVKSSVGLETNIERPQDNNYYFAEIILHSQHSGSFSHIWIEESIKNCVVEEDLWIKSGDHVNGFKGANEAIGTMVLKFDSEDKMNLILMDLTKYIKVMIK